MVYRAHTIRLSTTLGGLTCTPDHLLFERDRLRRAARISDLRFATGPIRAPIFGRDYKMGYLRGAMAGDGSFSHGPGQNRAWLRVCDSSFATRFAQFGRDLHFDGFREFTYTAGYTMRSLYGVRTSRVKEVALLDPYLEQSPAPEYMKGWLAGAFDAEGSNGGSAMLRIHQRISNRPFWNTATRFLDFLKLRHAIEEERPSSGVRGERMGSIRIGRIADLLRFVAMTRPVVDRKWAFLRTAGLRRTPKAHVTSRRAQGIGSVIGIETSTGTLIAGGFLSRACESPHRKMPGSNS